MAAFERRKDVEMADSLPPVPEGGFTSKGELEAWLESLSDDKRQKISEIISCRTSLRELPNIYIIIDKNYSSFSHRERPKNLLISFFRATLVARVSVRFNSKEIEIAAATAHHAAYAAAGAASVGTLESEGMAAANSAMYTIARTVAGFSGASAAYAAVRFSENASLWLAITEDARRLSLNPNPLDLLASPLWLDNDQQEPFRTSQERFRECLKFLGRNELSETARSGSWFRWSEWYDAISQGRVPWGLPPQTAWVLEKRIAVGDGRGDDFWKQEPEEINREIARWVEEARRRQSNSKGPAFISYNENDKADTIKIGRIIEEIGFDVFAQYKDMPPGSNFITEMNKGLDGMGKFVPVYSPDYVTSKACAAEWNAAFNMDRDGERRLIIGFMLRPATLPPLYRQIVHVPLYNLTEPQLRDAVRDALIWDGRRYGPARSREIAAEAALPAPTINMQGQIDIEASPLEAPFIDDDLARLPESMRQHIETLLEALEGSNCSKLLTRSLKNYLLELTAHGATPNLPDLIRAAELIENARLDAEEDGESWYKRSSKTALDQFAAMHEQLKQHFPLIMLRDISIDRTSIEADRFDEEEFGRTHEAFTEAATEAHKAGTMSDDYYAVMELRERQRRDIESLRAKPQPDQNMVFLHPADRKTPEDIKKRFLFDVSGSSDKLLSKTAQASQIADSETIKELMKAAGDLLKSIWG